MMKIAVINKKNMDRTTIGSILLEYIQYILTSFFYVLVFSYSTSPMYHLNAILMDSYIFQIIGKY